jgi:hypothetical protein
MHIKTIREFLDALRAGKFTSVGSYPTYFLTADGGVLSHEAAKRNAKQICAAIRDKDNSGGWRIVAVDINWENAELYCDDSSERIESAYAEPSPQTLRSL